MKLKFLVSLLAVLLLLTSATADRYIISEFKEGIISESGQLTQTNNPLTNVNILGYICLDNSCSTVGEKIFDFNSGPNDYIQLIYPKNKSYYGYAIYYYKPGYITWEQNPNWWGFDGTDPQTEDTKYLSKKQNCHAPIESFSVINDAWAYIPLSITAQARLDAETYSALFHNGPLVYIPPELENYYKVQTEVHLEIYDESDNIVYSDSQSLLIDFSGSENVEFIWTPEQEGNYKAVIKSLVTDSKCSSSKEETTSKEFRVLPGNPQNKCYTLLNDLELSNHFPNINELLTISYTKISNYINNEFVMRTTPTSVTYELISGKYNPDGNVIYSEQYTLESPSTKIPELIQFNWLMPQMPGWYTIYITGQCDDEVCNSVGVENIPEILSKPIELYSSLNYAPSLTDIPDQTINKGFSFNTINLDDYVSDVDNSDSEITWTYSGNTELIVDITNRIATITIPNENWYGEETITFRATDPDGLFNEDSAVFTVNPTQPIPYKQEFEKKHLFSVGSISLPTNTYNKGDVVSGYIKLRNIGQLKEKNIAITAEILDLGVETIVTQNLQLGSHDVKWVPFELELPYNLNQKEYLLKVDISNKHYSETKYIPIYIKDKYIFNF